MFYEEKLIDGILMFRNRPDGDWQQCDIEKICERLVNAEEEMRQMQDRWADVVNDVREQAYINGKHYEKDRIKELLGLGG